MRETVSHDGWSVGGSVGWTEDRRSPNVILKVRLRKKVIFQNVFLWKTKRAPRINWSVRV